MTKRFVDVVLGESFRVGNYLLTVLEADHGEVRMMIEKVDAPELLEEEFEWDDSWQYHLGD